MGEKRFLYHYGLPFSQIAAKTLEQQDKRVEDRKASMILIDGPLGDGKTTIGIEIMDFVNGLHGLPKVKLDMNDHPQLSLGGKEFTKNLRLCHEQSLPIVFYDESGDFNRRGSLSSFNAMLNRTFETFRGFQIVVILALPCFNSLDNSLFEKEIPRVLFHVTERSNLSGNFSVYSLKQMNWVRHHFKKLSLGNRYKAYSLGSPNYHGHFLDLAPERSKKLDKLSTASKIKTLSDSEIKLEGLMSYYEIAQKLRRSLAWVKQKIAKKKLKHKRVIKRKKYFDISTIDILADMIETKNN